MQVQTLISGSSGTCIAVSDSQTRLWLDCGFPSWKRAKAHLLPKAVLISHEHQDHFRPIVAKNLGKQAIPMIFPDNVEPFTIGSFHIAPFRVDHGPHSKTFGYTLWDENGVKASFFIEGHPVGTLDLQKNSRLVYIEANHDVYILTRVPNLNSQYHLDNQGAANVLRTLFDISYVIPQVIIGNISEQRNTPLLARNTVQKWFSGNLYLAPRDKPSKLLEIT